MSGAGFGMRLPGRRCVCGNEDLVAIRSGADAETSGPIVVRPACPDACWCRTCWPALRRIVPFPVSVESKAQTC